MIGDPARVRAWCEGLARGLTYQDIRPRAAPYLRRYFVSGWTPHNGRTGPAIFLHHFESSDPDDALHSHPWDWGLSLILVGGYLEQRQLALEIDGAPALATRMYGPGETNYLAPGDRHRVTLLERDAWTLFLAGEYAQPWQFFPLAP